MTSDSRFPIPDEQFRNPEPSIQESSPPRPSSISTGKDGVGFGDLETILQELLEILGAELYQYHELLRLLHAQRESFTVSDISSFEEISKQQGTVVLKVKTLEEARRSIVSRLAQYFHIPSKELTLGKLAALVDKPYSDRFVEYQREIPLLIKGLENLRENNAYLMQQALHYVSGVLRIFASSNAADFSYSSNGQLEHKAQKGKRVSGWG